MEAEKGQNLSVKGINFKAEGFTFLDREGAERASFVCKMKHKARKDELN